MKCSGVGHLSLKGCEVVVRSRNRGLERSERGECGGIETDGKDGKNMWREGNDGDEQSEGIRYL